MGVPFNNFSQPYIPNPNYMNYPQYQNKVEIVKVNGENGAKAYPLPANSSILLLDETAPRIWFKTTDGASYPTLKKYKITPEEDEIKSNVTDVDYTSLEERVRKLERMMSNGHNAKSNIASTKQSTESRS